MNSSEQLIYNAWNSAISKAAIGDVASLVEGAFYFCPMTRNIFRFQCTRGGWKVGEVVFDMDEAANAAADTDLEAQRAIPGDGYRWKKTKIRDYHSVDLSVFAESMKDSEDDIAAYQQQLSEEGRILFASALRPESSPAPITKKVAKKRVRSVGSRAQVKAFGQQLAQCGGGYYVHEVVGDGNCLFHAIRDQLHKNHMSMPALRTSPPSPPPPNKATSKDAAMVKAESKRLARDKGERYTKEALDAMALRAACCDYMQEHADDFIPFMEDGEDFNSYVARMRLNAQWGGHQELAALARMLRVNVVIHQFEMPPIHIADLPIAAAGGDGGNATPTLHVCHRVLRGKAHYDSVRELNPPAAAPAAAPAASGAAPAAKLAGGSTERTNAKTPPPPPRPPKVTYKRTESLEEVVGFALSPDDYDRSIIDYEHQSYSPPNVKEPPAADKSDSQSSGPLSTFTGDIRAALLAAALEAGDQDEVERLLIEDGEL